MKDLCSRCGSQWHTDCCDPNPSQESWVETWWMIPSVRRLAIILFVLIAWFIMLETLTP